MDEWEKLQRKLRSIEGVPEAEDPDAMDQLARAEFWKHRYEEEKQLMEERFRRMGQEQQERLDQSRLEEEKVRNLSNQVRDLEQRMIWEKTIWEEHYKNKTLETEFEKKRVDYEVRIRVAEESLATLRSQLREAQAQCEAKELARHKVELEKQKLEEEYRQALQAPRVTSSPDDQRRLRELENDKYMLERRLRELESAPAAGGNPQKEQEIKAAYEKELAALKDEHAKLVALCEQKDKDQLFSVEDMARGFAHKVRNHLGIMSGTLQLAMGGKLDEELKTQIVTVDESAQEMLRVIEEYLQLTKIPQLELQAVPMAGLVDSAVDLSGEAIKAQGVVVKKEIPAGLPSAFCDPASIREALRQILDNAAEASAKGGAVTVQARHEAASDRIAVEIIDAGSGIGDNHIKKVYQPYFSTKRGKKGMGLSFAKRAIELNQGAIQFTSAKGQGARFTVFLPVVKK